MKALKIFYYIVIGFIGLIALLLIVSIFPIKDNFQVKIVQSGSMAPAIKTGSIVVVKPEDNYKIGDVITFGKTTKLKEPITHRIYDIKIISGQPIYITKGDANNAPDQKEISKKDIVGKVLFHIPYLGYAVSFAKKPIGFILIIIIPAAAIVYDEVKNIWKEIIRIKKEKKKIDNNQEDEIKELKKEVEKLENEVEEKQKENK